MRVIEMEIQVKGNLSKFEIDVCRETLRATSWETKTWLPHHQSVQFRHTSKSKIPQGFSLGFM